MEMFLAENLCAGRTGFALPSLSPLGKQVAPKSGRILSQYLPLRDECSSLWYNDANGFQNSMLPTPKNRLRGLAASECQRLREMCRFCQNLYNLVFYNV